MCVVVIMLVCRTYLLTDIPHCHLYFVLSARIIGFVLQYFTFCVLRSSGILRDIVWYFVTDISGQNISSNFKVKQSDRSSWTGWKLNVGLIGFHKLYILWTVHRGIYTWEWPTICTLFLISLFQLFIQFQSHHGCIPL